jgi:RNA polymerase sigma-70 factor (family 1)
LHGAEKKQMNFYDGYQDQELVRLIANNDEEAFGLLYKRHWFDLYQSAFYLLKDNDASKDIVQDVFLWFWENRSTLYISNVKAYLKTAVRFKAANIIRSGNIRQSFFDDFVAIPAHSCAASCSEIIELKELQQIIQEEISELPEKCREVYLLSREQGLRNQDIAEGLGISIKTVEAQMTIAIKRLRTRIGFRYIFIIILHGIGTYNC